MTRRVLPKTPAGTTGASFHTPTFVEQSPGPLPDLQAQRIWVLERATPPRPDDDVCGYAGAVLVLWADRVFGLVVRSPERHRASEVPLREGRLRVNFDRDAFVFATLDEAVRGMERVKRALAARGWVDTDEGTRCA